MAVAFKPYFDPVAQVSFGLVAKGPLEVPMVNGLALVTGFMYGQNWTYCNPLPVTTWDLCSLPVTTTWVERAPEPITAWKLMDGSDL